MITIVRGGKDGPMTFVSMKNNSEHLYVMPESDSLDCRLDLKCYFEEKEQSFYKDMFCCQYQV